MVGSVVGSVSFVGGPGSVGVSLSSLLLTGVTSPAAGSLSPSFAASLEVFPPPLCPPAEERRRKRRQRESDNKTAILTAADLVEPRRKMRHGDGGARVLPTPIVDTEKWDVTLWNVSSVPVMPRRPSAHARNLPEPSKSTTLHYDGRF